MDGFGLSVAALVFAGAAMIISLWSAVTSQQARRCAREAKRSAQNAHDRLYGQLAEPPKNKGGP